jgi:hypothetical protein
MTRAAVVFFWNRLRPRTASTKRCVPSALQGVAGTRSPSPLALGRPRCARWWAGFVPQCTLARVPPLCATAPGAPPAAAARPRPSRPGDDRRRRGARAEPGARTSPAHARRGGVALPTLVGPCPRRALGQPSQRAWRHDGARAQGVVALARPEAPGERTAQPPPRLSLRRGRGLVGGPPWAPQAILRDRLLLAHRARPSATGTLRLERRRGAWVVAARQPLLPGLSPEPVAGRCHRAGPARSAQAWQSRAPCAALLRASAR